MNSIFELLKAIWKNKRYRSIAIFFIYIIFFTIIILMSKVSNNKPVETVKTPLEKFYNQTNYKFTVEVNEEQFNGVFEDNELIIVYNDIVYDKNNLNDFIYQDILPYLENKYIYELVKNKEPYSKTEYSDNKKCTTYLIDEVEIEVYENDKIYEIDIKTNDIVYKIMYI